MKLNPSQHLRGVSSLFFCFYFVFSGVAQASVFQKMVRSLQDVPQSKIEEVFGIVEGLRIDPKYLSKKEVRRLVRALDDPTHLVNPSIDGVIDVTTMVTFFRTSVDKVFFFSRFDLHKDSEALFSKLFFKKSGNKWKELPFEESKANWEGFLYTMRVANRGGHTKITETDLKAAAMSFIHQIPSDRYMPNPYVTISEVVDSGSVFLSSQFLSSHFSIAHYINPHFTLSPENPYHYFLMSLMKMTQNMRQGEELSLMNSKEFVLKIWSDIIKEIDRYGEPRMSGSVFLERIVDSMRDPNLLKYLDLLKAIKEAARENDHLAQLVRLLNTIERLVADNPEASLGNILEQIRTNPDPKIDQVVYDFLFRTHLGEIPPFRNSWPSDPAEAGAYL